MRRATHCWLVSVAVLAVFATASAENVVFTYTPPGSLEVTTVSVRGTFSEWGELQMLQESDGVWSLSIDLPPGEHEYKYYIDGVWPQDMEVSPGGTPYDLEADGYVSDGYGGQNAVRIVEGDVTGGQRAHPYVFKETILSENESLMEVYPRLREGASAAGMSMRIMYDVYHLTARKGFNYVIVHYREAELSGSDAIRLEFLNEAPEGYEVVDPMNPGPERRLDPERVLYDAARYVEFWDSQMGGRRPPPPDAARQEDSGPVVGYRIEDGEIVFEFRPADYQVATRGTDGVPFDLGGIPIADVAVAGEFNGWSTDAWWMSETGTGTYELKKALDAFSARPEWQFKFVVNERYWVEPPPGAANQSSSELGPLNLVLTVD